MFSKELAELDRNTVRFMIEEQLEEIASYKATLAEKDSAIAEKDSAIAEKDSLIAELEAQIATLQKKHQ